MTWPPLRLWARLNLVARVSLVVALSMLLVALGSAYQSAQHFSRKAHDNLTVEYYEQMDTLESVVFSALAVDGTASQGYNSERIIEVISHFKYGNDVTQIRFRDISDEATFSYDIAIQLAAPAFFSRWCGLERISINRPIIVDGVYYGLLSLSLSPNRIINLAWEHYRYLVQVLFLTLTTALCGIWFVLRKALHPLLSLAEASRTLTQGDLSVRVEIAGSPEVRTVLLNFNQMASSLQATLAALRESESRSQSILRTAMDGFWIVDPSGRLLEVNDAYCAMIGYSREELLRMTIPQLEVVESPEEVAAHVRSLLAGESACFETMHRRKDGGLLHLEVSAQRLAGSDRSEIVAFLHDITKRKQTEKEKEKLLAQLNQAQKMEAIGILAGGIAHDFNNILAAILGYTEMAMEDAPPGSHVAKDLDKVLISALRAKDLVKQILAFSRQSAVDRIPIKIQPLVKESLKMLRASIPSIISITEDIHPGGGTVLADPTQIHQIVMNLCTNAYHAMEETGGELSITVQRTTIGSPSPETRQIAPGEYVELTVSDTGTGIGHDIIDKIFDPYFTTKGIGKGSGMGLSITHGIIKSYGGAITVESALGKGTAFHVYIPVIQEEAKETAESSETPRGHGRILFVDDEELLMEMGHDMLERLGYSVISRRSGLEALETFSKDPHQFDLVITDQTMPGMTGTDLARRMLRIRPDIPIILCTGYSSLVNEESARLIGIREFTLKPLTKSSIAHLVAKVLINRLPKDPMFATDHIAA